MATAVLPARHDSYESYYSEEEDDNRIRSTVTALKQPEKRKRSPSPDTREDPSREDDGASEWVEKKRKKDDDSILTKTGGAYIPPARLRMMQAQITDKTSAPYQRMAWEALKKSINGLINKVNISNIADIVRELFQENIVRGRGLLARSVISAQSASPTFTHVYAALVAIINTKFPQIGELIGKRLIITFQRAFKRNDKKICLSSVRFIAHLVNQQVVHELLALELLTVLLEDPTSDSVEVAVGFLKECGQKLTDLSPRGIIGVFESLKAILHDASVDIRVQYMIEVMFAIRKDKFADYPSIVEGLDLINEDDQITHLISLDDQLDGEDNINVFKVDDEYQENEDRYKSIKEEILGEGSSDEEEGESDDEEESEEEEGEGGEMKIIDETQTDMLELRRTIYLTIMSSLDFEECAHKLLKMEFKPGQESEVANMIIECCSQERSYQRFYGLLGERFCHLEEKWVENFDAAFQEQYATVHRLETNKLRNTSKFFAQLFYTDALPWTCLSCIHLNEEETNSSSRIFIKILFQELAEYMGLQKLNERLKDPTLSAFFEGLMPRDNPKNTRFSINFFTSIGLGGLTDDLREHLKNVPKNIMDQEQDIDTSSDSDSDSDSDSSSDEDSSSDSSSSSEEEKTSSKKRSKRGGNGGDKKKLESEKMRRKKETRKDSSSPSPPPVSRNKRRSPSPERRRRRESPGEKRRGSPVETRRRGSPVEKKKGSTVERKRGSPDRRRGSPERAKRSPDRRKRSPVERRKGSPPERRRVSPDSTRRKSRREASSSPEDRRRSSPAMKDRRDRSPPQRRRHDSPEEEEERIKRKRHSPERRRDRSTERRRDRSTERRRDRSPERRRRDSPHDRRDKRNRSPHRR